MSNYWLNQKRSKIKFKPEQIIYLNLKDGRNFFCPYGKNLKISDDNFKLMEDAEKIYLIRR